MNKYGAKRTWSELCQREFASKKECLRAEELTLLEKAGNIDGLEFQVKFVLSEKPHITISIDFKYKDYDLRDRVLADRTLKQTYIVYEDSKGVLTRDTRTKLAWLREKFGIDVLIS